MDPKRYFPAVAIGGAAAGAAIAIPILGDILRCCLCVGVMAGAGASMKLWLDAHPASSLTPTEGMLLGACSGAVTAAVSWLLSLPIRLAFGLGLSSFYDEASFLPEMARSNLHALYTPSAGMIVMSLPLQGALYGLMGGVGGFLALHTAFKARLQPE
jgi:hypothetical protein